MGIEPIAWHVDRLASHVAIATMVNWRWTGYNALILLAAMQAVPRDLYESAALDGAGRIRQFLSITMPMIRPTMVFVIITSTIGGLQIFAEPRLFDDTIARNGGSDRQFGNHDDAHLRLRLAAARPGSGLGHRLAALPDLRPIALVNFLLIRRVGASEASDEPPPRLPGLRPADRVRRSARPPRSTGRSCWAPTPRRSRPSGIPPLFPGGHFLANAQRVFDTVPFWKALGNSVLVSSVSATSVVFFCTLAGYAFAKLRFRGREPLLVFVIATMAVPTQLGVVPLFILMAKLGWTGTLLGDHRARGW